jgi:tetratricopeptide (TPR) repeat protein
MDFKQLDDLNVSIDLREQTAALLKTKIFENEDRTTWLLSRTFAQLSFVLFTRHEHTRNTDDLDRAIEVQRESLRLAKEQDALSWWSLGHCLMARVGCTTCGHGGRNPESIDEAVKAFEQGLAHAPPGDPATNPCVAGLARALHFRFNQTKHVEDLERSIETFKRVTILTQEGDTDLPIILEELGEALNSRFTVSGDIIDINDAIAVQHKVLFCTPPDLDISWRLHKLASYYHHRAAKFGEPEYLEEADRFQMAALQSALASSEKKEDTIPLILTSVLEVRAASFAHGNYDWGKIEDIVQAQQQILDHFPRDHHARWSLLEVLGKRYTDLFRKSGQIEDIQKAIDAHRESCEALKTPSNLSSLGSALLLRFELTKDRVDIEEAITLVTQAIDMGPDNTMLTRLLYLLGEAYAERYSISQDSEDLDKAISDFQSSASSSVGPQGSRLEAAMAWAHYASKKHGPIAALDALDVAMDVITLHSASQDQGVTRRHQRLSTTSFVVLDAAARALRAERVDKALQYLEQGRGVVWRQLHDLRMPAYPAAENHPLVDRLGMVSRDLDAAERKIRGTFDYDEKFRWLEETPVTQRILFRENEAEYAKIAKEREDLLRTIRETIPDFGRFLLPTSINDWIKALPEHGVVVVVNVTKSDCDAIILSRQFGEPKHLPLDKFSGKKAKDLQESLRALLVDTGMLQRSEASLDTRAVRPAKAKSSPTLPTILRELWLGVVKPVVDVLGLQVSF